MNIKDIRQELAQIDHVAPLEGQHYANCLRTYEANSNQRELILGWFSDHVIPQLATSDASFLSIGCGAGELDVEILAAARGHSSSVSYVGLEPDARQCERFMSRMVLDDDPNIRVEARNSRFEHFSGQRRFDLVLMVHSLYYMDNPGQAIQRALKLVNQTGRLVILIASNDTLNELSSSFWKLEQGRPAWFSEDLGRHLDAQDIAFERRRIEATLNVTSCFDAQSEQGVRIADFVAQVPTKQLPPRLRKMIFSYLDATSQHDGELRWLPHSVDAFVIQPDQADG